MGIFDCLGKTIKAAVGVATLPIDVVKDVVTMGGVLTDKKAPYTASKITDICKTIDEAYSVIDKN